MGLASLDRQYLRRPSHTPVVFCVFLSLDPKGVGVGGGLTLRGGTESLSFERRGFPLGRRARGSPQFAVGLFVESACHKASRVFAFYDSFTFHQTMMLTSSEAALKYGLSGVEPSHWNFQRQSLVMVPGQVTERKLPGRPAPNIWGSPAGLQAGSDPKPLRKQEASRYPTYKPKLLVCGSK